MATQTDPPLTICGFRHPRPEANNGHGCRCLCQFTPGRTGYLLEDADTPKLVKLGMAIYVFPADTHPTAGFPRREIQICYRLAEIVGGMDRAYADLATLLR